MTPPRAKATGTGGPAKPPPLQPRPAARAQAKAPAAPEADFPPNPVVAPRRGPEQPTERSYRVVGPKAVGGVLRPGTVVLSLTDAQAEALEAGGHVELYIPEEDQDPEEPMTGTEQ